MKNFIILVSLLLFIWSCTDINPFENECENSSLCEPTTEVEIFEECYDIELTTELDLENQELSGLIPIEIGSLINLVTLNLSYNALSGEIPAEIENLINLETLRLNDNSLSGEIPSEIGNLTLLGDFRLHNNNLSGEVPSGIANMSSLQSLYLDFNDLSGVFPEEIQLFENTVGRFLGNHIPRKNNL